MCSAATLSAPRCRRRGRPPLRRAPLPDEIEAPLQALPLLLDRASLSCESNDFRLTQQQLHVHPVLHNPTQGFVTKPVKPSALLERILFQLSRIDAAPSDEWHPMTIGNGARGASPAGPGAELLSQHSANPAQRPGPIRVPPQAQPTQSSAVGWPGKGGQPDGSLERAASPVCPAQSPRSLLRLNREIEPPILLQEHWGRGQLREATNEPRAPHLAAGDVGSRSLHIQVAARRSSDAPRRMSSDGYQPHTARSSLAGRVRAVSSTGPESQGGSGLRLGGGFREFALSSNLQILSGAVLKKAHRDLRRDSSPPAQFSQPPLNPRTAFVPSRTRRLPGSRKHDSKGVIAPGRLVGHRRRLGVCAVVPARLHNDGVQLPEGRREQPQRPRRWIPKQ